MMINIPPNLSAEQTFCTLCGRVTDDDECCGLGTVSRSVIDEVNCIEKETNDLHRRTKGALKWLDGSKCHGEFLLSRRWDHSMRQIVDMKLAEIKNIIDQWEFTK